MIREMRIDLEICVGGNIYYQENRVIIMYGEHNVIYSLNAIYRRKWEVSILASGGEHQSISLH